MATNEALDDSLSLEFSVRHKQFIQWQGKLFSRTPGLSYWKDWPPPIHEGLKAWKRALIFRRQIKEYFYQMGNTNGWCNSKWIPHWPNRDVQNHNFQDFISSRVKTLIDVAVQQKSFTWGGRRIPIRLAGKFALGLGLIMEKIDLTEKVPLDSSPPSDRITMLIMCKCENNSVFVVHKILLEVEPTLLHYNVHNILDQHSLVDIEYNLWNLNFNSTSPYKNPPKILVWAPLAKKIISFVTSHALWSNLPV